MSEETTIEKFETILVPPRQANHVYIAENIDITRETINKIKEIIKEKFAMLEYLHNIKVAFLWTMEKLNEDEFKQLSEHICC